jgi:hypothetical protein
MAHKKYTVKQGDCISSIAYAHDMFPDTIWNDPENAELKEKRKDPYVLLPGDVVSIRDKEVKEVSCASEQRHRFKRKGVPEKLTIQFMIEDEVRACDPYVLEIDGTPAKLGNLETDERGIIDVWIPPRAMKAKITFTESGDAYEFDLGRQDPITEISGVQGRLRNLGFYEGAVDGKMSEELEQAIADFQASQNPDQEPSGTLDDATRSKIVEIHGS